MTETEKYKLKKPDKTDYAKIETLNDNADVIDAALAEQAAAAAEDADALAAHLADRDNPHGVTPEQIGAIAADTLGQPGGPAQLGADGKLPADQLGDVGGGGSLLTLRFDAAFLGCTWTLTGGGESCSGTVDESLTATASVKGVGTTYTLAAELDGVTYTEEVTTAAYFTALEIRLVQFLSTIAVTIDSGSTVTATMGNRVLTKTSTGKVAFNITKAGKWTITATLGEKTAKSTVEIAASGESITLDLVYADVFGVCWDTSNSSTALTRLTPETDPYGLVTQSVTTEPVPAVSTGAGSSPFDNFMPWSGMKECNLNADGSVQAWKGDSAFSRENAEVMVYIPEFYFAFREDFPKKYFYIADGPAAGTVKHPGSGKYVGRYHMMSSGHSVTGKAALVSTTRAAFRTLAKSLGAKFHLYDFATYCAIVWLYLIEFADWDSQSKIGSGVNTYYSEPQPSGKTDSMSYHTGKYKIGTDIYYVQYRWIENLWGNAFQLVDGYNSVSGKAYYCLDPDKYADSTTVNHVKIGDLPSGSTGWLKDITVTENGLIIPKECGGSASTYIPDQADWGSNCILCVGGDVAASAYAGLMYFHGNQPSGVVSKTHTSRLMAEP